MKRDILDIRILAELDNDSRQNNSQLAKKLHVNKNVVNYRIKNLESSGIIKGYYTIIDTYKLGYQGYRMYIKFQYTSPKKEAAVMDYFVRLNNTWWVAYMQGNWEMAVLFWVRNHAELVGVLDEFQKKFRNFVEDYIVVVYYGIGHYRLPFTKKYLKNRARFEYMTAGNEELVDSTDRALLQFLGSNARAPLVEIAKRLGLTPPAVKYRLDQLQKKRIILGFRPIFNIKELGYSQYKLDINLTNIEVKEKMQLFAREHDNIFYLDETLGYADIEFEIYVEKSSEFFAIVREIRKRFSDDIKDHRFFMFEDITKISYMPTEI